MIGVGDLVVCVNTGPIKTLRSIALCRTGRLVEGAYYRVEAAMLDAFDQLPVVIIEGVRSMDEPSGGAFLAERFRKIRPDEHAPCEEEFRILLQLSKRRVKTGERV